MSGAPAPARPALAVAILAVAALAVVGCTAPGGAERTLTVFAAASLEEPLQQIADRLEQQQPGLDIALSVDGSASLVAQVGEGAPADILATANQETMDRAVHEGLTDGEPQVIATNRLALAVPRGNPADVRGIEDLQRPGLRVVLCAPGVPCGDAAATLADRAGITLTPVSEESSVSGVLTTITTGEADAGIVYTTDIARSDGKAQQVPIPEELAVRTTIPIAQVRGARNPDAARAFLDAATSEDGQSILAAHGFGPPEG